MKKRALALSLFLLVPGVCIAGAMSPLIFASYAGDGAQLSNALILAESVRTFGGEFAKAPVWIYVPARLVETERELARRFASLGAEIRTSEAPAALRLFPYAGKVFAAARAEAEARGSASLLAWMDDDTVVLKDPRAFLLAKGTALGYRPVTHRNIGSLYAEPLNVFWRRVYEKLAVPESAVFPMKTVADGETLRPYFNAGLLVARPERGIMAKWAGAFSALHGDPLLVDMCVRDERARTFLHQAALAGAILSLCRRNEIEELPDSYNYPVFFKEMYGAEKEFSSIDGVVTLRYDAYFRKPAPDWADRLQGPAATISWLRDRLGKAPRGEGGASTKMRFHFQEREGKRT